MIVTLILFISGYIYWPINGIHILLGGASFQNVNIASCSTNIVKFLHIPIKYAKKNQYDS